MLLQLLPNLEIEVVIRVVVAVALSFEQGTACSLMPLTDFQMLESLSRSQIPEHRPQISVSSTTPFLNTSPSLEKRHYARSLNDLLVSWPKSLGELFVEDIFALMPP